MLFDVGSERRGNKQGAGSLSAKAVALANYGIDWRIELANQAGDRAVGGWTLGIKNQYGR
ncbi:MULTISPECIES: hypothetical protein [Serratia]|uniref:hypothetical protein n=1 Tax=Serratia TaxID=613 RepID=UPI0021C5FCAA|nr:hypothetical protein [Serratia liquefaciens]